jgi:hypothetical protein
VQEGGGYQPEFFAKIQSGREKVRGTGRYLRPRKKLGVRSKYPQLDISWETVK